MMNTSKPLRILLALGLSLALSACKKTELVPYEQAPSNRIESYTVTNAQEAVQGIVDDVDNTITVYVPYYINIDFIIPQIRLAQGATLIDAAGNRIDTREDLEPVPFDTVGYTYRVKDDKNNIRSYTLVTRVTPFKEPLKLGYSLKWDENGNAGTDDEATKEAFINSRINIYGNLESSSKNARLTLIRKRTNTAVPNALKLIDVGRNEQTHYLTVDISAELDSGLYTLIVAHQGRKDTLPDIHMIYKRPYFGLLPKPITQGQEFTMTVQGPTANGEIYSGVNTGVKRAYIKLTKSLLSQKPAGIPENLYDKPIELEIVRQNRTSITFKFPESIPAGLYESIMSAGSSTDQGYYIVYTGFGVYFDFDDSAWGNDNLISSIPYLSYEVKPKQ